MKISADTTALVTGANRGLGLALVETLLKRGAGRVYAAARTTSTLSSFERYGDRVVPVQLDLTDPDSINTAAAGAPEVNLLINNAAAAAFAPALLADRAAL